MLELQLTAVHVTSSDISADGNVGPHRESERSRLPRLPEMPPEVLKLDIP